MVHGPFTNFSFVLCFIKRQQKNYTHHNIRHQKQVYLVKETLFARSLPIYDYGFFPFMVSFPLWLIFKNVSPILLYLVYVLWFQDLRYLICLEWLPCPSYLILLMFWFKSQLTISHFGLWISLFKVLVMVMVMTKIMVYGYLIYFCQVVHWRPFQGLFYGPFLYKV